jgi:glycosyltransferase involved in cell wall biosynthesis
MENKIKLRVAICEPAGRGGICHYTRALSEALQSQCIRVLLFTARNYELGNNTTELEVSRVFDRFRTNPVRVGRMFRRFNPQVVHLQTATHPILHLALLSTVQLMTNSVSVVTAHNVIPKNSYLVAALASRLLYLRAHRVIVHAHSIAREIQERFNLPTSKVAVIPHGDYSFLAGADEAPPFPKFSSTILFFGYLHPAKGLIDLIEAMAIVKTTHPTARLVIAGKPEMPVAPLKEHARAKGVADAIVWHLRYMNLSEVRDIFKSASLVVLPYREASQSGVALLAGAFARPVVATNTGALPTAILHEQTGLIVTVQRPSELAKAIVYLLRNPSVAEGMGRAHYERCKSEFNWNVIAQKTKRVYLKAFRELMSSRNIR